MAFHPEVRVTREQALADLHKLCEIIETTHPDPFLRCGGRVAFFRKVSLLANEWSDSPTLQEAWKAYAAVMALLEDGHSLMHVPFKGPALPVSLGVVGSDLVVCREGKKPLKLLAVNGVPIDEVVRRCSRIEGHENESAALDRTGFRIVSLEMLSALNLAEAGDAEVALRCENALGEAVDFRFQALGEPLRDESLFLGSSAFPKRNAAKLGWAFLDDAGERAMLAIDDCSCYREEFLHMRTLGVPDEKLLSRAQRLLGRDDATLDEILPRIPAAVEMFAELFSAMRERRTKTLIVDVRRNRGGDSLISRLLSCFLAGKPSLKRTLSGFYVERHSPLLAKQYPDYRRPETLWGGYGFESVDGWENPELRSAQAERETQEVLEFVEKHFPGLSLSFENPWWSPQIFVLTSAVTGSSGFCITMDLWRLGAKVAGVAPSQAANCYIDILQFELPETGLAGGLSFIQCSMLPEEPERGRLFRPDVPLEMKDFLEHGWQGLIDRLR